MKKLLAFIGIIFVCAISNADTINLHWLNDDGSSYQNTTCVIDGDLIIPNTAPTKYGYTFTGWKLSNYIPLEYIESTGTQYIDTGIGYTTDTILEVVFQKLQTSGGGNNLFGSGTSFASSDDFSLWCQQDSGVAIHLPYPEKDTGYQISGETITEKAYLKVNLVTRTITLNNSSYVADGKTTSSGSNVPIRLFATPFASQYVSNFIGRVFSFKLYNGVNLVRDFIPALDSNGVACMYDTVSQTFFYNAGTGDFIAGPVLQQ